MSTPTSGGRSGLAPDVVARLDAVPLLAGVDWRAEELSGGLTNHNYRLMLPAGPTGSAERSYVARLANPMTELLAIDRDAEHACALAAARAGVAPAVVDYAPAAGVMLIEWVPGRTYEPADLRDSRSLPRVVEAVRRLHAADRFVVDFTMVGLVHRYLDSVRHNGFRLPARFGEFLPAVEGIQRALAVRAEPAVACHNDLLAANVIDDGDRIWLIDYEYAGNNDPSFELGNLWSESNLAPEQLVELVELYYGEPSPHRVARARLQAVLSQYGWMAWAAIQDAVSGLDFDFWSWGLEKYDRAVAALDGPQLPRWLAEAADGGGRPGSGSTGRPR